MCAFYGVMLFTSYCIVFPFYCIMYVLCMCCLRICMCGLLYWVVLPCRVVLSFIFFCTRVGLLPPGANPIAVNNINNNNNNNNSGGIKITCSYEL
jgi:hypothetical protein